MKWLKYMLLIGVWLASAWPCMHVAVGDIHHHGDAAGIELCASESHECHCHSCSEVPCADQTATTSLVVFQNDIPSAPGVAVSFRFPAVPAPCKMVQHPETGILDALQTVRLLI